MWMEDEMSFSDGAYFQGLVHACAVSLWEGIREQHVNQKWRYTFVAFRFGSMGPGIVILRMFHSGFWISYIMFLAVIQYKVLLNVFFSIEIVPVISPTKNPCFLYLFPDGLLYTS